MKHSGHIRLRFMLRYVRFVSAQVLGSVVYVVREMVHACGALKSRSELPKRLNAHVPNVTSSTRCHIGICRDMVFLNHAKHSSRPSARRVMCG